MKRTLKFTAAAIAATAVCLSARAESRDSLKTSDINPIERVVVTGTRSETDVRLLPMTVSVVGRKKIDEGFRNSILPSLTEHVPGLFVTSRGIMGYGVSTGASGGMSMRGIGGSPTTGLLVLIDGHPQYMGLMGHPIADACQPMLAEKVEVVRGPASVLYGSNAMGGVINIVTRKTKEDGASTDLRAGYGSYNTVQSELTNRVRVKGFTSTLTGSYNHTNGHRRNMGFEQYGGYGKFGYEMGRHWNAAIDLNVTHFNASNPGTVSSPLIDNDSHITRGMASFALHNEYAKTSGSISVFNNWGVHKINDGYPEGGTPPDYRFNSRDRMSGVSVYQSIRLFKGNRTTFGADYFNFGGKAWNKYVAGERAGERSEIADKEQHEVAGYVDFRQNITHWLIIDAGIRYDHNSHCGGVWIPQGGVSFLLPRSVQIKAMVSKGFRFPTIREMYMFPPQNPDLKPESLVNYELSLKQDGVGGIFSYGLNVYYIDGDDSIILVPTNGRMKYMNTGRIRNFGIECETELRFSPAWTLSANYSWLKMKYPVVAAPEHKLFCGINFAKRRWNVSTGVLYIRGLYTQTDPVKRENFVLWNADMNFRAAKWLEIFVRGENLLAQRYEINAGYPMPKATVFGGLNFHF